MYGISSLTVHELTFRSELQGGLVKGANLVNEFLLGLCKAHDSLNGKSVCFQVESSLDF